MESKKISTRQFMLLYILLCLAAAIRIFPTMIGEESKGHSYLAVIIGAVGSLLLSLIFARIIRDRRDQSLCDVVQDILTKPVGKIILAVYMIWSFLVFSLYLRFYAEQIVSSLLPKCRIELVMLVMILFVYRVLRGGIVGAARLNEILFFIFTAVFVVVSVATVATKFDPQNLDYFGGFDVEGLLRGSLYSFAVFAYIVFMFFFFDKVKHKGDVARLSRKAIIFSTVCGVAIILCTVGVLGYKASSNLEMPYFSVAKNITVFTTVKQFQAVLYTIWMIVDYTMIMVFGYINLSIFKALFNYDSKKIMTAPVLLLGSATALFASRNSFMLNILSRDLLIWGNVILESALLPILFVVGKLRKKI